jgi:hypothetical protein
MRKLIVATCLLIGIVGCSSPHHVERQSPAPWPVDVPLPGRYYVAEAALRYMFDKYAPEGKNRDFYSAYVLDGREFTLQLETAFRDYKPRVTDGIRVSTRSGEARDTATGKRVKVWSVQSGEPQHDEATAYVSWYVSPLGAAGFILQLQRRGEKWIVVSEKMEWVS